MAIRRSTEKLSMLAWHRNSNQSSSQPTSHFTQFHDNHHCKL